MMVEINNYIFIIPKDITTSALVQKICQEARVSPDDIFAYSAYYDGSTCILRVNSSSYDCYTVHYVAEALTQHSAERRWLNPPLDVFYDMFQPMLGYIRDDLWRNYSHAYHEVGEIESIVNQAVMDLYAEGAYLWKNIIQARAKYIILKELHEKKKEAEAMRQSIENYEQDDAYDAIYDEDSDLFSRVKKTFLEDVTEDEFNEIVTKISTKTVDCKTSRAVSKVRSKLGCNYVPRPNSRGCKRKER